MMAVASIVIPTYNHAQWVADAIDCALAQTVPCEVIVVDDGSTDGTRTVLDRYAEYIRVLTMPHGGPSAARNAGIEVARGDFIMFLDADDFIAADKVDKQLAEFDDDVGFVLCDVRIEEVSGRAVNASDRYRYADLQLHGWIGHQLDEANFIPIMSPLLRRSVLGNAIRFSDAKLPEDWHFWHAVARVARCRYVPEVLATYRKRTGGRNSCKPPALSRPSVTPPLRLNLGCGTPNTPSWHPMPGFVNLDRSLGWRFEDGLGEFADGSVAGISVSHSMMYVSGDDWPGVVAEFARVLKPGGVVRITEDDTTNPASSRYGGWRGSAPAVTLTDPAMVRRHLEIAGFTVHDVTADTSRYPDASLCQAQHGKAPDCFWIEGVRECALLLEPHADDAALFASFTAIRYKPRVVTCFPSSGDYGDTDVRHAETRAAMAILGAGPCEQWYGTDLVAKFRALDAKIRPTRVWAPSTDTSHPDHRAVAVAAAEVFGDRLTRFHTYNAEGKVRTGAPVPFEPGWVERKFRALACYRTQLAHPRARVFFADDLAEYQE